MSLEPILSAPIVVQIHVCCAVSAAILGPIALLRRSRDLWHRRVGTLWVAAMFLTAVSSFAISDFPVFGRFSPIHLLSCLTFLGLWQGVVAARRRDIARHQREMRTLYFWAMGVAGLFTFLPERRMNRVFFDAAPQQGFAFAAVIIGAGLVWYSIQSRKAAR